MEVDGMDSTRRSKRRFPNIGGAMLFLCIRNGCNANRWHPEYLVALYFWGFGVTTALLRVSHIVPVSRPSFVVRPESCNNGAEVKFSSGPLCRRP
jgi:hypothetical protein